MAKLGRLSVILLALGVAICASSTLVAGNGSAAAAAAAADGGNDYYEPEFDEDDGRQHGYPPQYNQAHPGMAAPGQYPVQQALPGQYPRPGVIPVHMGPMAVVQDMHHNMPNVNHIHKRRTYFPGQKRHHNGRQEILRASLMQERALYQQSRADLREAKKAAPRKGLIGRVKTPEVINMKDQVIVHKKNKQALSKLIKTRT